MAPEDHLQYIELSVKSSGISNQGTCFMAYAPWDDSMNKYLQEGTIPHTGVCNVAADIFTKTPATLDNVIGAINSSPATVYKIKVIQVLLKNYPNMYSLAGDGGIFAYCK